MFDFFRSEGNDPDLMDRLNFFSIMERYALQFLLTSMQRYHQGHWLLLYQGSSRVQLFLTVHRISSGQSSARGLLRQSVVCREGCDLLKHFEK